jgi:HlyD family secretion protein
MKKSKTPRWVVPAAVVAVLLGLVAVMVIPRAVEVEEAAVTRGQIVVTVDHEGRTRVRDRFVVSAPVAGRVLRIDLEPGDPVVAASTVLATFEPATPVVLDPRTHAEAAARVAAARARLDQSRAQRDGAEAQHAFAVADLERLRSLAADGLISSRDVDVAETKARSATEDLVAAEAGVRSALHDLESANAALLEPSMAGEGSSRRALRITAPVDGVVLVRHRESESVVAVGEPLLEVADPERLEVIADYLSSDAVRIRPGMSATIERWGGDTPLDARVRRVEPAGFMKLSALGVEEQRVWVILDLESPHAVWAGLGDGYRIEARVVLWSGDDVLQVPTSSLFRDDDGSWAVLIDDDGRASHRRIEIGHRNGLAAEVVSWLDEGDVVIVHPPDTVDDGSRISHRTSG